MPLSLLAIGERGQIVGLTGSRELRRRLTELGFLLGRNIEILQHSFGHMLIVGLEDSRMALDRKLAHHVHIDLDLRK